MVGVRVRVGVRVMVGESVGVGVKVGALGLFSIFNRANVARGLSGAMIQICR
jgi:hypothetical protein